MILFNISGKMVDMFCFDVGSLFVGFLMGYSIELENGFHWLLNFNMID